MRNLVVVVILFCTVSFELVSASPGFFGGCGCGLGRRKRDASSPGDPLEGLVLEAPLWTEDAHECPQNRWKSIMRKAMNESVDAIHAKFSIQRAIESELGDHFFIACADHKPSFVANGDAFCSYGEVIDAASMNWIGICIILCAYGLLKDFRPSEPYLFLYQNQHLNISEDVLNGDVYPYWTYSYLIALVPVFLITDLVLYKPILLLESVCCVAVWLLLIFGRTVWSQQLGQILYGWATAAEVAYIGYMYVKVDRAKFERVTVYTRAALQGSRLLSYLISQPIVIFHWGTYLTLNYISLGSLLLTVIFALLLPNVKWQSVVLRSSQSDEKEDVAMSDDTKKDQPNTYWQFAQWRVTYLWHDAKQVYSNTFMVKWSLWWALTMCGYLQIGNYIQTLWAQVQDTSEQSDVYNGFVEALCPLISGGSILLLQWLKIDWKRWGELWLALAALLDFALLYVLSMANGIWLMYFMYGTYHVLYHIMITVSQYNLATGLVTHSYGFIFGLNTMVALALQSAMTFAVVDKRGLGLPIRTQFIIYAGYHALIALIFLATVIGRFSHRLCRQKTPKTPKDLEESVNLQEVQ